MVDPHLFNLSRTAGKWTLVPTIGEPIQPWNRNNCLLYEINKYQRNTKMYLLDIGIAAYFGRFLIVLTMNNQNFYNS
jgi:hypothetical protein